MPRDRVVGVYGWDLQRDNRALDLRARLEMGYRVLALDRAAADYLSEQDIPFRFTEEELQSAGIGYEDFEVAAEQLRCGWTETYGLVSESESRFPDLDLWIFGTFWRSAILAARLATALRINAVEEFVVVQGLPPGRPALHDAPDDLPSRIFARLLTGVTTIHRDFARSGAHRLRTTLSRTPAGAAGRMVRSRASTSRFSASLQETLRLQGSQPVTLAMVPFRELVRSRPVLLALQRELRERIVLVPWEPSPSRIGSAPILTEFPHVRPPSAEVARRSTQRRFAAWLGKSIDDRALGELEPVRSEVRSAVVAHAGRLAQHAERLQWLISLLHRVRPTLAITARNDLAYEIPTLAAVDVGIPVVTIPHGVVLHAPARGERSERVVHLGGTKNPTDQLGLIRTCREALVEHEYPHRVKRSTRLAPSQLRVLALPEAAVAGVNAVAVGWSLERQAFRILDEVARRLSPSVTVAVKPHPGTQHPGPMLLNGSTPSIEFLRREEDLIGLLEQADVVLAVNNHGSALVHAVLRGIPIVHLVTKTFKSEPALMASFRRGWSELWAAHGPTVRDAESLTTTLARLRDDDDYRQSLAAESERAAAALMPDGRQETLRDILSGLTLDEG